MRISVPDAVIAAPSALRRPALPVVVYQHLYSNRVTLLLRTYESFRDRLHMAVREFAKFGIIGAVNTLLDFGLFNLLITTTMADAEVKAKVLSSFVATISAYLMNRYWTFRHRPKSAMRREYVLFFALNAVGWIIQGGAIFIAKYGLHLESLFWFNVINVLSLGVGMIFRFWSYRRFVWILPNEPEELNESGPPEEGTLEPLPASGSPR